MLLILISFALSLVSYFLFSRFVTNRGLGNAALAINAPNESLTISLNGEVLGKTPYYSDSLKAGEQSLVLTSGEGSFRSKIKLSDGALTVVNYSPGPTDDFSEGEIIWLEKSRDSPGGSLLVISDPDEAEVRLDGELLGQTPLASRAVASGDHALKIIKEGYKSRSIKIQTQPGYKLNLKVRLMLLPLNAGAGHFDFPDEPRFKITDFSTSLPALYADTSGWAKGLVYYTRNLEKEASPSAAYNFYLFLDYKGQTFDKEGIKAVSFSPVTTEEVAVAYLGRRADGGLSDDAKEALRSLAEKILTKVQKVQILPTGLGYLNVRQGPSAADLIVARINEGEKTVLLSEAGNYFKVRLPDGKEGYVSKRYARKI